MPVQGRLGVPAGLGGAVEDQVARCLERVPVELADQAGITLIGFLRDHSMNVYTHPERVV